MNPIAQKWEERHRYYQLYFFHNIMYGVSDDIAYQWLISFDDSFRTCGLKAERCRLPVPAAWG